MERKCSNCGRTVPEDSSFCQYCGSNDIKIVSESSSAIKRCTNCGKELPNDSEFCQYCGSKVAITVDKTNNARDAAIPKEASAKDNKDYKKSFIIVAIIAVCACLSLILLYVRYNDVKLSLNDYIEGYEKLEKENKTLQFAYDNAKDDLSKYKTKASNYDTIKNSARGSSNSNFFATQTVLKNPNKTRVVFYIPYDGSYTISWNYSSNIVATTGNTSSGLVYLDITYNGSGVGTIDCTNSVNSSKITIYCIGN